MLSLTVREAREFATHYKNLEGGEVELIKLGHCEKCNSPYVVHRDRLRLKGAIINYLKLEELQEEISSSCRCTPDRQSKTIEEFKNPFDPAKVTEIRKIALDCITDSIALFAKCMCFYQTEQMDEIFAQMQEIASDISNKIRGRILFSPL